MIATFSAIGAKHKRVVARMIDAPLATIIAAVIAALASIAVATIANEAKEAEQATVHPEPRHEIWHPPRPISARKKLGITIAVLAYAYLAYVLIDGAVYSSRQYEFGSAPFQTFVAIGDSITLTIFAIIFARIYAFLERRDSN